MLTVDFHSPAYYPDCGLIYVIIGARYLNKWVFIKHKQRKGYELPAGHIDEGEDTETAARRELEEETGAKDYKIECISTYTVCENNKLRAGRLYYAEIETIGEEKDEKEIDDIILSDSLPSMLSFHYVQAVLFDYLQKYFSNQVNPG
ncbi:MAG: NUDIX domain-containing protein [Bacteroidales bacterium]|nr:NUDIX domain-containing protein [Bacteroidales bacterium]